MMKSLFAAIVAGAFVIISPAQASDLFVGGGPVFSVAHDAQGTGNYKGKRDRHEKPGPMKEKKRKRFGWIPKR